MYITEMRCDSCQTKISDGDDFEMLYEDSSADSLNDSMSKKDIAGLFVFIKKPLDLNNDTGDIKHFCGEGCMFKFISKKLEGSPE